MRSFAAITIESEGVVSGVIHGIRLMGEVAGIPLTSINVGQIYIITKRSIPFGAGTSDKFGAICEHKT